jgi:hypothetical protein
MTVLKDPYVQKTIKASDTMKKNIRNKYVYVVKLDSSVLKSGKITKDFLKANPNRDPDKLCLYVGRTGLSPEQRFAKHKSAKQNGKGYVTRYGIRLLPDLYDHLNPMTWDEVVSMEIKLAMDLRAEGYGVWQN